MGWRGRLLLDKYFLKNSHRCSFLVCASAHVGAPSTISPCLPSTQQRKHARFFLVTKNGEYVDFIFFHLNPCQFEGTLERVEGGQLQGQFMTT